MEIKCIKENIFKSIYYSAIFLLFFLSSLILTTGITYILHGKLSYIQMVVSIVLSVILLILMTKKEKNSIKVFSIVISILVVLLSVNINGKYYDIQWDSNQYHKDAIGALKSGWNPVYDNYIDFYRDSSYRDMDIIGDKVQTSHGLWQTYYAKGAWYVDANFYYVLNDIESAKVFNILSLYICLILSFDFLVSITDRKVLSIILAIIYSLSPVVIVELFNCYNDGALSSILLCLIIEFIQFIRLNEKKYLVTFFSLMIVCCNIKFTGLAYAGVICVPLYLLYLYKNKQNLKKVIKPTVIMALSVIVSVVVAGFQPYVTNLIEKGNPLYPLAGKDKVDIISYNQPPLYNDLGTLQKFNWSIFSKTANINQISKKPLELKFPLFVYDEELTALQKNDLRIGGFGPLFSGIFVLSLVIIVVSFALDLYNKKYDIVMYGIPLMVSFLLLIFIISDSWWARYTPYVYYITLLAATVLALKNVKICNVFLSILLMIFSIIIFY